VEKNKNKIELIINGRKNNLVNKCKMQKGENNIMMIIKIKLQISKKYLCLAIH